MLSHINSSKFRTLANGVVIRPAAAVIVVVTGVIRF
jgi:hypothetical protein